MGGVSLQGFRGERRKTSAGARAVFTRHFGKSSVGARAETGDFPKGLRAGLRTNETFSERDILYRPERTGYSPKEFRAGLRTSEAFPKEFRAGPRANELFLHEFRASLRANELHPEESYFGSL